MSKFREQRFGRVFTFVAAFPVFRKRSRREGTVASAGSQVVKWPLLFYYFICNMFHPRRLTRRHCAYISPSQFLMFTPTMIEAEGDVDEILLSFHWWHILHKLETSATNNSGFKRQYFILFSMWPKQ